MTTPRWNGDSTVVAVYLAHVPAVESWTLSVGEAGAWRAVHTVPNVIYTLGTPQGVTSQREGRLIAAWAGEWQIRARG